MVEQADTRDLKSRASQEACRFKSGLQHHLIQVLTDNGRGLPGGFNTSACQPEWRPCSTGPTYPTMNPDNEMVARTWQEQCGLRGSLARFQPLDVDVLPTCRRRLSSPELEVPDPLPGYRQAVPRFVQSVMATHNRQTRALTIHHKAVVRLRRGWWSLIVGCAVACFLVLSGPFVAQRTGVLAQTDAPDTDILDLTSLNIRLSQGAIHPPQHLVREVVTLPPSVRVARTRIAPSPKAAVLEDDHHNRALIVSVVDDSRLQVTVLADLNFASTIPFVTSCAGDRGCAYDRSQMTGGLGCVAICIQQALDPSRQP